MERRHIIDQSPFRRLDRPPDNAARSRVLNDDELRAVFRTSIAGKGTHDRIVALLCLLGQRPHEIAGLQWNWIKGDRIEFPAEMAKNKQPWVLPMVPKRRTSSPPSTSLRHVPVPRRPPVEANDHRVQLMGSGQSSLRPDVRRDQLAAKRPPSHLRHQPTALGRPARSDRKPPQSRLGIAAGDCRRVPDLSLPHRDARSDLDLRDVADHSRRPGPNPPWGVVRCSYTGVSAMQFLSKRMFAISPL